MRLPTIAFPARIALLSGIASLITGCAQWGGEVLKDNHVAFNTSVAQAMDRQMLLNIVRMSMDEPTQWMTVSAINVNTSVTVGPSGRAYIPANGIVTGDVGGAAAFSYTPNITFVPRQGEQLARELMSPIPVASVEHMVSASWPISWIFFLTCERIQDVSSFDVTRGFGVRADDERFGRMMQLLDTLQEHQLVSLSQVPLPVTWNKKPIPEADVNLGRVMDTKKDRSLLAPRDDGGYDLVSVEATPVLTLYPGAEKSPAGRELMEMLKLGDKPGNFPMMGLECQVMDKSLTVRTRSLAALLRLLSFGVDTRRDAPPPSQDVDCPGELWTLMRKNAGAEAVDLSTNVNAVFRVQRGDAPPPDASVSVPYRGEWFWLDAKDETARQVFALVRDLFDLQVSSGGQTQPVLTVPVGR